MTIRTIVTAAALATLATVGPATAAEVKPARAQSIDLGTLSGVAYYTAEPKGYRVVVTLAPRAAAPATRFEAVLGADQSVTVSTPRQPGAQAESVEIAREGDRVLITPRRTADRVQEAAALD